jgi:hypothetical protein
MKSSLRRLWKRLCAKENWESRMGWEIFVLIFIGSLLAGLGSLF